MCFILKVSRISFRGCYSNDIRLLNIELLASEDWIIFILHFDVDTMNQIG